MEVSCLDQLVNIEHCSRCARDNAKRLICAVTSVWTGLDWTDYMNRAVIVLLSELNEITNNPTTPPVQCTRTTRRRTFRSPCTCTYPCCAHLSSCWCVSSYLIGVNGCMDVCSSFLCTLCWLDGRPTGVHKMARADAHGLRRLSDLQHGAWIRG